MQFVDRLKNSMRSPALTEDVRNHVLKQMWADPLLRPLLDKMCMRMSTSMETLEMSILRRLNDMGWVQTCAHLYRVKLAHGKTLSACGTDMHVHRHDCVIRRICTMFDFCDVFYQVSFSPSFSPAAKA